MAQQSEIDRLSPMEIDLHGYHPGQLHSDEMIRKIIRQAWEMGVPEVVLIHGHGRNRGRSPGFVNTNTGYLGLQVRSELRHDTALRDFIKRSTLFCGHEGSTAIRLKRNPAPSRSEVDWSELPDREFAN